MPAQIIIRKGLKPGRHQIKQIKDQPQGKQGGCEKSVEGQKDQDFAFEGGAFLYNQPFLKAMRHVQTAQQAKDEERMRMVELEKMPSRKGSVASPWA